MESHINKSPPRVYIGLSLGGGGELSIGSTLVSKNHKIGLWSCLRRDTGGVSKSGKTIEDTVPGKGSKLSTNTVLQ